MRSPNELRRKTHSSLVATQISNYTAKVCLKEPVFLPK